MTHSIISWDCSYRNFFHLIDGLLIQDYPKEEFELIYVEQRNKEIANQHNHKFGLKTLEDRFNELRDKIQLRVLYLNEVYTPLHWGKCVNAGIKVARGEIISIMDGDQLLPSDFLKKLTKYHLRYPDAVVNIHRRCARYPVGVKSYKDWLRAKIDFFECLDACVDKYSPLPRITGNKGPLISARRKYWEEINGYDPHPIWSTPFARLGGDVTKRLEIAAKTQSVALPDCFSVHPWHPNRVAPLRENDEKVAKFFALQERLISWSIEHNNPSWKSRAFYAEKLYKENKELVKEIISSEIEQDDFSSDPSINKNLLMEKLKCKTGQLTRKFFYRYFSKG